ncbi:MAG TPA: C1 family peptidase [Leptospiraceae bacterium]|nr:C1 family peptidase [Leptospiraceae bacterium]
MFRMKMEQDRIYLRSPQIRNLAVLFLFAISVFAVRAEEKFDPSSVQPETCGPPLYACGVAQPDLETMRAIPVYRGIPRGLPSSADISSRMPPPSSQGRQGSCVSWATAYATRSFFEQAARNWGYDAPVTGGRGEHIFSPAYIYNQVNGGRDQGSTIPESLQLVMEQGVAPWSAMPYSDRDYRTKPNAAQRKAASRFRIGSYAFLARHSVDGYKAEIAAGRPIPFAMTVYQNFYNVSDKVYDSAEGRILGGHAMVIVGYDDDKVSPKGDRGAFKIMNSWSKHWGQGGFGWISYKRWLALTSGGYAITPVDLEPEPLPANQISPPVSVTATQGAYSDRVVVYWAAVRDARAFTIYRAEPGASFEEIGNSGSHSFTDRAVKMNVAYRYRVSAVRDAKVFSDPARSPIAEGYAAMNPSGNPQKVTGLMADAISIGRNPAVRLSWTPTPGASSYEVSRYDSLSRKWKTIQRPMEPQITDSAVAPDATVSYSVRAIGSTEGPWSDAVQLKIAGEVTVPSVPSNVRAVANNEGIMVISWDAVPGAESYNVIRYSHRTGKWTRPASVSDTQYVDKDSTRSAEDFLYCVAAKNRAGTSDMSFPAMSKGNPGAGRRDGPPAPADVKVAVANGKVTLSWQPVRGAKSYAVYRSRRGSQPSLVATVSENAYNGPYAETGLSFYTVRARSPAGESLDSPSEPVFADEIRPAPRGRGTEAGIERFTGKWKGTFMASGAMPTNVTAEIRNSGGMLSGSFQIEKGSAISFSAPYAEGASAATSQTAELRLMPFGLLEVHIHSPGVEEVVVLER